MRKAIEYILLDQFDPSTLFKTVNDFLRRGYELYGSPAVVYVDNIDKIIHYQAVVKYNIEVSDE